MISAKVARTNDEKIIPENAAVKKWKNEKKWNPKILLEKMKNDTQKCCWKNMIKSDKNMIHKNAAGKNQDRWRLQFDTNYSNDQTTTVYGWLNNNKFF